MSNKGENEIALVFIMYIKILKKTNKKLSYVKNGRQMLAKTG